MLKKSKINVKFNENASASGSFVPRIPSLAQSDRAQRGDLYRPSGEPHLQIQDPPLVLVSRGATLGPVRHESMAHKAFYLHYREFC